MKIDKRCETCEFNFDAICAGEEYGRKIENLDYVCTGWSVGFHYFKELYGNFPWFIEEMRSRGLSLSKVIELVEKDDRQEEIELNPIKVINKIYGFREGELAKVLNVSIGVIHSAEKRGVPLKRQKSFANGLMIPQKYMRKTTNLDFNEIEACAKEFWNAHERPKMKLSDFERKERSPLQNEISDFLLKNGLSQAEASRLLGRSDRYISSAVLAPSRQAEVAKLSRVFTDLKELVELRNSN